MKQDPDRIDMKKCSWPGCDKAAGGFAYGPCVNGRPSCAEHAIERLKEEVAEGTDRAEKFVGMDASTRCNSYGLNTPDSEWSNRFARLCCEMSELTAHGLNKADIEERAEYLEADHPRYRFSIERHPVGRITRQEWEVDTEALAGRLIGEVFLETEFPIKGGSLCCPECYRELALAPGRVSCSVCGFREDLQPELPVKDGTFRCPECGGELAFTHADASCMACGFRKDFQSKFPVKGEDLRCPECGDELWCSPGRAQCPSCDFLQNFQYV